MKEKESNLVKRWMAVSDRLEAYGLTLGATELDFILQSSDGTILCMPADVNGLECFADALDYKTKS